MKIPAFIGLLVLVSSVLLAQDFSAVKEGMTKAQVVKLLGNPAEVVVSDDKTAEYEIWYKKGTAWLVAFTNGKSTGPAGNIKDLLKGLVNLAAVFSDLGASEGTPTTVSNGTPPLADDAAVKSKIRVDIVESKVIETWDDQRKAGCRLKVVNNSDKVIKKLEIVVYYLDSNGKAFFEQTLIPVDSESWTNPAALKPNYSVLYPPEDNKYATASGMDLSDWDEGNIRVEVTKAIIE